MSGEVTSTSSLPPVGAEGTASKVIRYAVVLALVGLLTAWCAARTPFFGDLPLSVKAIHSGRMYIQFPGYIPFHLLVASLASGGDLNWAFVLVSALGGALSTLYIMLTAEFLGGKRAAWTGGVVAATCLLTVYFSAVGASYMSDMVAVAGLLYHGLKALASPQNRRDIAWAACWVALGLTMRLVSSMWALPALIFLAWRWGGRKEGVAVFLILGLTLGANALADFHYYGSLENFRLSLGPMAGATLNKPQGPSLLSSLLRLVIFPVYFFQVWLALGVVAVMRALRRRSFTTYESNVTVFLLILAVPYCFVLVRHLPQGGYLCFLAPIVIVLPFVFNEARQRLSSLYRIATGCFVTIAALQLFVFRPIPVRSTPSLVLDAYMLQYSRAGIAANMFETLASLALKTGIEAENVPADRRRVIEQQQRNSLLP